MAGSQTFDRSPTTTSGLPVAGGVGGVPPPANPIAVATDPATGAAVIRQTEAPREVATGVGLAAVPADKRGNEQELMPLPAAKGAPLTGDALIAAVGPEKAKAIEATRVQSSSVPPPVAVPAPPAPRITAAGALSQAAQALGLRVPRRPRPGVATTEVEKEAVEAVVADGSNETEDAVVVAQHLDADDVPLVALSEQPPLAPIQPHQKAASNTDSPSRGLPQPIADPGKKITGGFGELTDGQYHPLNGFELRTLVEALMDDVHRRLADDLRFSMALTYPRVRATVQVVVECIPIDNNFVVEKVAVEPAASKPGGTPLALAKTLGDQIVFVVAARRQEFDDAGGSISPPNAIREELGIEVPRKQRVETPTGYTFTDRKG